MMSALLGLNAYAQTVNSDKILGKWTNEDKTRVLEFVKNGSTYEAVIRSAEDKSLVGKKQITGLKVNGSNTYKDGTVFLFKKNSSAKCSITFVDTNKITIKATKGLYSKSQAWFRL